MRLSSGIIGAVALALAVPAAGQSINVGTQVTDAAGGAVGTVVAVQGDNLVIKTDKHEAVFPRSSFVAAEGKLLFGMTQAQLNAEIESNLAAANAAIVVGATVNGASGTKVGVLESVADDSVVIKLGSGHKIQIGRSGIRGNADGTVTIGLTAEQLEAQVQPAKPGGSGN